MSASPNRRAGLDVGRTRCFQVVRDWPGTSEHGRYAKQPAVIHFPPEINTGLMFRTNLSLNEGMLFLLPVTQQAAFYLRNTLIPLSCAYLDDEGVILELHDMIPKDETTILSASANIRYVVETNRGWFERNHVGPGTLVRTERGTLADLLKNN